MAMSPLELDRAKPVSLESGGRFDRSEERKNCIQSNIAKNVKIKPEQNDREAGNQSLQCVNGAVE